MEIVWILFSAFVLYKLYREISWRYCLKRLTQYVRRSAVDVIFVLDQSMKVARIQRYDIEVLGYLPEELVGCNLWNLLPAEVVSKIANGFKKSQSSNSMESISLEIEENGIIQEFAGKFLPLKNGYTALILEDLSKYDVREVFPKEELAEMLSIN